MKFRACSGGGNIRGRERCRRSVQLTGFITVCAMLVSCQSTPMQTSVFRRDFKPDNIFVYPPRLALEFRRVAVLPIAAAANEGDLPAGCEALAPVLIEQLVKTKKFEAVTVDGDFLFARTGRTAWTGRETLPPNFFGDLRREYDCDGVLFAELTTYRAYAPMAVGWRFKLVDARTHQVIWASDELFDASQADVRRAAVKFEENAPILPFVADNDWAMLNSPRRFGRYTAAALFDTLPER
jgi:hypothetical protein